MGLHENILREHVRQLTLREPATVAADATVRDAIEAMRAKKLGCAVMVDDERRPVGMFTESMLTRMLVQDPSLVNESLGSHVAEQWPWVKLDDPIADVLEAMQLKNVRFICVVDDEGRLAGLTGQKGLMEYIADHFPEHVMVQRIGSKPFMRKREGA